MDTDLFETQKIAVLVTEHLVIHENKLVCLIRLRNIDASLETKRPNVLLRNKKMAKSGEISKANEDGNLTG